MTDDLLSGLGWSDHFARQAEAGAIPARIAEVQRDLLTAIGPDGPLVLRTATSTGGFAVGDWVLHDGARVTRRLEPRSEIRRRAAGPEAQRQLIAANVDMLGIVTSCNADFNPARLERYLAMASSADTLPLVILTKADLAEAPDDYVRRASRLSPLVTALALDATDAEEVADRLAPWLRPGMTLALVGSSGVGKTTILNAVTGGTEATQGIREDDAKGRHTTTFRSLRPALSGGWVIDTPGMREVQLADAGDGIDAVFADVADLATRCRFSDCAHETEPGCAVQAAITAGELEPERLARWRKLQREDRYNSETIAEARARTRGLNKHYRAGKAKRLRKEAIPGS